MPTLAMRTVPIRSYPFKVICSCSPVGNSSASAVSYSGKIFLLSHLPLEIGEQDQCILPAVLFHIRQNKYRGMHLLFL